MATIERDTLQKECYPGSEPPASWFFNILDSYVHKGDRMDICAIEGLAEQLNGKYDAALGQHTYTRVEALENSVSEMQEIIDSNYNELDSLISGLTVGIITGYATEEQLEEAIGNIRAGGRNYVLKSDEAHTTTNFYIDRWAISSATPRGRKLRLSLKATSNVNDTSLLQFINADGVRSIIANIGTINGTTDFDTIVTVPDDAVAIGGWMNGTTTLQYLNLRDSNVQGSWTPAPEDIVVTDGHIIEVVQQNIEHIVDNGITGMFYQRDFDNAMGYDLPLMLAQGGFANVTDAFMYIFNAITGIGGVTGISNITGNVTGIS